MRDIVARSRFWLSLLLLAALVPSPAAAQQAEAVLLVPEVNDPGLRSLASGFDRVLRARLEALEVVRLGPTPALGLEDLRLAVGCLAASDECHAAVARQVGASVLLMPAVERVGSELVLTLVVLEAESSSSRRVMRRSSAESEVLDAIDPMVREAFGLPAPEPEPVDVAAALPSETPSAAPSGPSGGMLAGAAVLLGVGVITLSLGLGVGVASTESMGAYQRASVGNELEIDAALAHLERASTEATAANVLLPVGGAMAAGGMVWLLVELLTASGPRDVALVPTLSPTSMGLVLRGAFGGER